MALIVDSYRQTDLAISRRAFLLQRYLEHTNGTYLLIVGICLSNECCLTTLVIDLNSGDCLVLDFTENEINLILVVIGQSQCNFDRFGHGISCPCRDNLLVATFARLWIESA